MIWGWGGGTLTGAWISGISLGAVIVSGLWIRQSARSIKLDRASMDESELRMREMLDELTAAAIKRSHDEEN